MLEGRRWKDVVRREEGGGTVCVGGREGKGGEGGTGWVGGCRDCRRTEVRVVFFSLAVRRCL